MINCKHGPQCQCFVRARQLELEADQAHAKGYREGWAAAGKAIARELQALSGPLAKAVNKT